LAFADGTSARHDNRPKSQPFLFESPLLAGPHARVGHSDTLNLIDRAEEHIA